MKSKMLKRTFISLVATTVLMSSTSSLASEKKKEIKARWISLEEKADFSGMLVPENQFNEATVQMLELKICEDRLKNKNCSDSLERDANTFYVGVIMFFAGGLAGYLANEKL
jgi:hypothetical protein